MNVENQTVFSQEEGHLDIKAEILKYLRYWPWFIISVVVALLLSYFYLRYTPNVYQTTAKIKILDESKGLELPTSALILNRSKINLENDIQILTSYRILEKVVKELDLTSSFYAEGRVQTVQIASLPFYYKQIASTDSINKLERYELYVGENGFQITNEITDKTYNIEGFDSALSGYNFPFHVSIDEKVTPAQHVGKTFKIGINPLQNSVISLKSRLKVEPIGDVSHILSLTMNGVSSDLSEIIINKTIEVFNEDGVSDRQSISKRTLEFIDKRFVLLAKELDSIEVDIKDFQETKNLIDLPTNTELSLGQRTKTDEQVYKLEGQLALVNFLRETLQDVSSSGNGLLPANIGLENNSINSLTQQYNLSVLEKEKLISSAGENNPSVQLLSTKINDLRRNINTSLQAYSGQLQLSLNKIKKRNQTFKSQVSDIPENTKILRGIQRQQRIKESLYLFLLQKREEAAINYAITEPSLKVVESAISGSQPISPKSNIIYAAAFLLSILIPFGVLYLIFMLDTKLHSKEDIASIASNIPVIGEIPDLKKNIIFNNPNDRSALAESFRILSSNANYILPANNKGKVIYCTSTIKGEGKTFISLNLSLALSSINKRVLLIGADLRNPQIHSYIDKNKETPGLSNYLHDNDYDWRDALINGFEMHPNHHIILSGTIPPNPAHLLTNGRLKELLDEAKEEYDYIIVDTAPTILVTDTMLISQYADATVYLTRANYTEKNLLKYSKELSENGKIKNMAYVINSVGAGKSHGYGYGYNYGYGYGYGSEEETS